MYNIKLRANKFFVRLHSEYQYQFSFVKTLREFIIKQLLNEVE